MKLSANSSLAQSRATWCAELPERSKKAKAIDVRLVATVESAISGVEINRDRRKLMASSQS